MSVRVTRSARLCDRAETYRDSRRSTSQSEVADLPMRVKGNALWRPAPISPQRVECQHATNCRNVGTPLGYQRFAATAKRLSFLASAARYGPDSWQRNCLPHLRLRKRRLTSCERELGQHSSCLCSC